MPFYTCSRVYPTEGFGDDHGEEEYDDVCLCICQGSQALLERKQLGNHIQVVAEQKRLKLREAKVHHIPLPLLYHVA